MITTQAQIVEKVAVNHDCYVFTMRFIKETICLSAGQHVQFVSHINNEEIRRKYTPISPPGNQTHVKFLIKIYRKNVNPLFPEGGKLTPYLQSKVVGDKIVMRGPLGRFFYANDGLITLLNTIPVTQKYKRIFFVAGGTGITPVFHVLLQIISNLQDKSQLILLFANKSQQDIILRKQLQSFAPRLQLHFILDKVPQGWKGFQGHINKQIMCSLCPLNDKQTLYIHCGPKPMNEFIKNLFEQLYPQSILFKF